MSYYCVLAVFPSSIAKCLFFVETLTFLAESRQGLKCAGSHRVADPAHFDLPGLCRVSWSLVYSYSA